MTTEFLRQRAEAALELMRKRGFDGAQVGVSRRERSEVNVAHNEASLLRSTDSLQLDLVGLLDGRRASTDGNDLSDDGLAAAVAGLWDSVRSAPQDDANAVSSGQTACIEKGPRGDGVEPLARATSDLLSWRARETPTAMIEEAYAAHLHVQSQLLTSGGSALECDVGCYELVVMGVASENGRTSSFNTAFGRSDSLAEPLTRFGIARMMRDLTRQVYTQPIGSRFVGEVVLTPQAVSDLVGWLLDQIGDAPLIDGSSLYRGRVGEKIASPLLTLKSRFDGPGCVPVSSDAFATPPVEIVTEGRLQMLTPSLYGSRKTGIAHVPVADSGWEVAAGTAPVDAMVAAVPRGALVDRLSMGEPSANGDFSGVIKNSFAIEGGRIGAALSETMISGNVARMLEDIIAVSRERTDSGVSLLPWLRIGGLHFS